MLWWLVVAWVVVVGGFAVWIAIRGAGTARHVASTQRALEPQIAQLQGGSLAELGTRQAQLQERIAKLQVAVENLNRSLERLRLLIDTWNQAVRPLRMAMRFFRP
jgi:TolA-binding protein